MKIGGRVEFDRIDDLEKIFRSVDFPIELALPWKYQDLWLPVEDKIDHITDFFKRKNIEILSLHATQGKITEESFLRWGKLTIDIAQALGVNDITIHPNKVKDRKSQGQQKALSYIKRLRGNQCFSIETFGGGSRVFTPYEIIEKGLQMTLDTSHIRNDNEIMEIINIYHGNIKIVHLSAKNGEEHLPIDEFCLRVVDQLIKLKWSGNLILEYLPWHHYRLRDDIKALYEYVSNDCSLTGNSIQLLEVSDQFKNFPDFYGYNMDGTY